MAAAPATSITLLGALASGTQSVRWTEFVRRYEGLMREFVATRYPTLDADDVLQDVLLSLMKALPEYRYTPDEKGHFRNYLLGVVRHKAVDAIRRRKKEDEKLQDYVAEQSVARQPSSDGSWQDSLMHAALAQLMADDSITSRNREIFRHVALLGEPPESVAADFGVTRGNVDIIKNRMIARLQALVATMREASA